jgi:hypothetical protein
VLKLRKSFKELLTQKRKAFNENPISVDYQLSTLMKMRSFSQRDLTFPIFRYVNNFDLFSNQQEKVKLKIMLKVRYWIMNQTRGD